MKGIGQKRLGCQVSSGGHRPSPSWIVSGHNRMETEWLRILDGRCKKGLSLIFEA